MKDFLNSEFGKQISSYDLIDKTSLNLIIKNVIPQINSQIAALDIYPYYSENNNEYEIMEKLPMFNPSYKNNENVTVHRNNCVEAAKKFKDGYFDWIYIDTDHSYKTTIKELEAYRNKIKHNGFIAGHDYLLGNWNGWVRYGVKEAVYEFCTKYNWEIVFLTSEINNSPSFAIKDINRY